MREKEKYKQEYAIQIFDQHTVKIRKYIAFVQRVIFKMKLSFG
jgi:hypothetical protein